jgi:hypothetical protein
MRQGKQMKIFDKLKKCNFGIICALKRFEEERELNVLRLLWHHKYLGCKEWTMKKLSVFLLATVFIFGLAVQAGAQEQGPHQVFMDAFSVDDTVITFDDVADPSGCTLIANQYIDEYGVSFAGDGVSFSEGLFGDPYYSSSVISLLAATNFNVCDLFSGGGTSEPFKPISVTFNEPVTRVGFLGFTLDGTITVTPIRDGVAGQSVSVYTCFTPDAFCEVSKAQFIGIEDLDGIDAIVIEGDGAAFVGNELWIDDLTFGGTVDTGPAVVKVKVNIKPPDCLGARIAIDEKNEEWVNFKSKGVTPVVIMGNEAYDVTAIDPDTILLQGVEPVRWALEDAVHCNAEYGDGMVDLTLKFNTQDLVQAIRDSVEPENLQDGSSVSLKLTGELYDLTPIENDGDLRVTTIMKGKHRHEKRGRGNMHPEHDRGHHKGWDNNRGYHKGLKNHQ